MDSTLVIKNSHTYCKNLLVIETKYYAHASRGIDWQEKTIARQEKEIELKEREVSVKERSLEAEVKKTAEAVQQQADAELYATQKASEAELFERQRKADAELFERQKNGEAAQYEAERRAEAEKATAEAVRVKGEAEAAAIRARGEAEAAAIAAKAAAEAEGLMKKAEAMKQYGEAAQMDMKLQAIKIYFEQLPAIAEAAGKAYTNVDKIVMFGGESSKLTEDVVKNITQLSEGLSNSLGVDLKDILNSFIGTKMAIPSGDNQ